MDTGGVIRISFLLFGIASVAISLGCNRKLPDLSAHSSARGASDKVFEENGNSRVLRHDFGVVVSPLEEPLTHEFEIRNDTDLPWTLKEIVNTCSCSVAGMTTDKIEPGETGKALVAYSPIGSGVYKDQRKTLVVFEEEKAPRVLLYVSAQVKQPMTIQPETLAFMIGENLKRKRYVEIQNWSDEDWNTCRILGAPSWLTAEINDQPLRGSDSGILQRWEVDITVDASRVVPGRHSWDLHFEAIGKVKTLTAQLPVRMIVSTAVSAIPAQLFFGEVEIGERVEQTLKLRFCRDLMPQDVGEFCVRHSLGRQMELDWLKTGEDTWELAALLVLEEVPEGEGTVATIEFLNEELPSIEIPLYFFVKQPSGGS